MTLNKKFAVAGIAAISSLAVANAGVFNFETIPEGSPAPISTSTGNSAGWADGIGATWSSLSTSGNYGHLNSSGYYSGGVISNSASNSGTTYDRDIDSASGGGAGGSSNFGVIFFSTSAGAVTSTEYSPNTYTSLFGHMEYLPPSYAGTLVPEIASSSFITDEPLQFQSIDVSLTSYDFFALTEGNSGMGVFSEDEYGNKTYNNIYNNTDSFFVLRIYGIDENYELIDGNYTDVVLASNDGGTVTISPDWQTVDLSSLNTDGGLNGLAFQILTSFGGAYGASAPCYAAIDNISAIPEPAECALLLGFAVVLIAACRRRIAGK